MQIIELYADPEYDVQVLLDGTLYFLKMSWNTEARFWVLGIQDFERTPLVDMKLVPNKRLLKRYRNERLPQGELIALSASDTVARRDFVDRYATMIYVPESYL